MDLKNSGEPLLLGVIIGTHGLQGHLKVRALSPDFDVLLDLKQILLRQAGRIETRQITHRPFEHKGNIILRLAGFEDVEAAGGLVGAEILAVREELPQRSSGKLYWFQMQGMTAIDQQLGVLGTLEDLFTTAAHDIYVVQGEYGEILIPVVELFVVEIDTTRRRIVFDLPEGLVSKPDDL